MAFLDKGQFNTIISITVIDKLTGGDDGIINTLIDTAVDEMKSYLRTRYDVTAIFDAGALTPLIAMYCKDITLYHLFSRSNQSQLPAIRDTRYKQALTWLNDVQDQKINPINLPVLTTGESELVKAGGNTKRNNHQE
jgi:phage gp36-like protein